MFLYDATVKNRMIRSIEKGTSYFYVERMKNSVNNIKQNGIKRLKW